MLEASHGAIDVWCVYYDAIRDEGLLAQYWDMLSAPERVRQQQFYFPADRHRYLVTRAAVRTILSRYAALAPAQWEFANNAYGRPAIANPGMAPGLVFNLSHTSDLIVVGVTRGLELGVDTEPMTARAAPLEQAGYFFSASESAALRALPLAMQPTRFFQYWTLKESYIKARGKGLSIPLTDFGFELGPGTDGILGVDPRLKDDPARWHCWQYRADGDYLVSICASALHATPPAIRFWKSVPLAGDCAAAFALLARTRHPQAPA